MNDSIIDFSDANIDNALLNFKRKRKGQKGNYGRKDIQIMVPLIYLSNVWKTLEMPCINCEINLFLNWSGNCFIVASAIDGQVLAFVITDTKLYVRVATITASKIRF